MTISVWPSIREHHSPSCTLKRMILAPSCCIIQYYLCASKAVYTSILRLRLDWSVESEGTSITLMGFKRYGGRSSVTSGFPLA